MADDLTREDELLLLSDMKQQIAEKFFSPVGLAELDKDPQKRELVGKLLQDIAKKQNDLGVDGDVESVTPLEFGEGVAETLPVVGAGIGGALGGPLGAGFGGMGGEAFGQLLKRAIGSEDIPQDSLEAIADISKEGSIGLVSEFGGQTLLKGVATLGKLRPLDLVKEIKGAAKAIDAPIGPTGHFEPTSIIGKSERALAEGGTLAGLPAQGRLNRQKAAVDKAIKDIVGEQRPQTRFDVGSGVKSGIEDTITMRRSALSEEFEALQETFGDDLVPVEMVEDAIELLGQSRTLRTGSDSAKAKLNQVISKLSELREGMTIRDIKEIRTAFRESLPSIASPGERKAIREAAEALTQLRNDSIIFHVSDVSGEQAAQSLASRQIAADKRFSEFMSDLQELTGMFGVNKKLKSSADVMGILDKIPEEQIANRLFSRSNISGLRKLRDKWPQQFKAIRDFKIADIVERSSDDLGNISAKKMLNQIKKLEKETAELIFSQEKRELIKNLNLVVRSMPESLNPSGTSIRGDLFDPLKQITALIPAIGKTVVDNPVGRNVIRASEFPTVRTIFGQTAVRPFTNFMFEKEVLGFRTNDLFEVEPGKESVLRESINSNANFSSIEKAKHMNLLNKRGLGAKIETEEDKALSPRDKKLSDFIRSQQGRGL